MNIKIEEIRELIKEEIKSGRLGGAAISVFHPEKLYFTESYGSYKNDSIYRLYSMTKIITSIAILKLIERGKLEQTSKVSDYLPGFKVRKIVNELGDIVDAQKEITVQHLLNMTSGICYAEQNGTAGQQSWWEIEHEIIKEAREGKRFGMVDVVNRIGTAIGDFEAGMAFRYGTSADVLGGIAEVVSGLPYEDFLKKEIFDPLEMEETGFWISADQVARVAPMYTRDQNTKQVQIIDTKISREMDISSLTVPDPHVIRTCRPLFVSAGGGLYSTISDYQHLTEMLLLRGKYKGRQILKEETVDYMCRDQMSKELRNTMYDDPVGKAIKGYGYSNLVRIMDNPEAADYLGNVGCVGEFGWDGMPGNYVMIDPKNKLSVIFMVQVAEGADLEFRAKLRKAIYEENS